MPRAGALARAASRGAVEIPAGVELDSDDGGQGPAVVGRHSLAGCRELLAEPRPVPREARPDA